MSTRANSLLYLVLRYRGPARVDGDTLARRRQKCQVRVLPSVLVSLANLKDRESKSTGTRAT